ncbi:centromere/kinetochore protein zw10 homolog [Pollicipes pollicipes]|uniref:centromere/kinetochore protein zw10 homolog n=1 Tax=Pollicipes pollicipes TaxID=41117 RepID=UPI001884E0AB|nr:centromere/kinetochore protein zw10 homolog [Pollicipes pollicipes]
MLELYCALLPTAHRRALHELPEQAAIAHNNCQYLAHRVTALAARHSGAGDAFLDLVPELRQVGSDIFLATLTRMKNQLLEILSEAGLDQLDTQEDVAGPAGAALRQCLHQLAQQDISASAAGQLCQAARLLVQQAPGLFASGEDYGEDKPRDRQTEAEARALLARHTAGWARFLELLVVLEENLRGILDRWSDGKGPLAQHFSADEARHLVRALFQNSERRAAALARIK